MQIDVHDTLSLRPTIIAQSMYMPIVKCIAKPIYPLQHRNNGNERKANIPKIWVSWEYLILCTNTWACPLAPHYHQSGNILCVTGDSLSWGLLQFSRPQDCEFFDSWHPIHSCGGINVILPQFELFLDDAQATSNGTTWQSIFYCSNAQATHIII